MRGGTTSGSRRRLPSRPVRVLVARIRRVGPPAATCSSIEAALDFFGVAFALAGALAGVFAAFGAFGAVPGSRSPAGLRRRRRREELDGVSLASGSASSR